MSRKVIELGTVYETCLFEADKVDMLGMTYDRDALVAMIPNISKKPGVVKVWMDGDCLMARVRDTPGIQKARERLLRRR